MMTDSLTSLPDLFWDTPDDSGIDLSSEHFNRAVELSRTVFDSHQQWQLYLHSLALSGVKEWLASGGANIAVNDEQCSLLNPPIASLIDAVCNLCIGEFRICLIATGYVTGPSVWVPRATLELPSFTPHYYLLVEVAEDEAQAKLYGYLRCDRLHDDQTDAAVTRHLSNLSSSDWDVALPLTLFDTDTSALLTELCCLRPEMLPNTLIEEQFSKPATRTSLVRGLAGVLSQLLDSEISWRETLPWQEGIQLLQQPDLLAQLYQARQQVHRGSDLQTVIVSFIAQYTAASGAGTSPETKVASSSETSPKAPIIQESVAQRAINAAYWLSDRLDQVAQELSWTLMPVFASESALRSHEFNGSPWNLSIPPEARGIYHDVDLGSAALRLHVITWPLSTENQAPGWTLLAVLGAQPETILPAGIQLQISDNTQLLSTQVLMETIDDGY
ncbi:MAG: DUF1822 family protein, partial [Symploca sp. SIO2B6]|nr:DUF1822 family protein [Symploca sp. SIO2B6]